MFPLRDSVPSLRRPFVTWAVVGLCTSVFLYEFLLGPQADTFIRAFGFVPRRFFEPDAFGVPFSFSLMTLLTSMFMHGGWLHLIGNMWFLWVFGDNVEDALGHGSFVLFYLFCGVAAALAQAIIAPSSIVPMVGASGAIAGVLGAYMIWYPWSRVRTLIFLGFFVTVTEWPAPAFLLIWFVIQFFSGTMSLAAASGGGGGVAFFAHIGGFVAGFAIAGMLRLTGIVHPRRRVANTWE